MIDNEAVGRQIALLRTDKGLTQSELGERLGVSFQAVSKWERGETLPDTALLPDLANVLETTVDNVLCGTQRQVAFKGKYKVSNIVEGLNALKTAGEKLGHHNIIYRHAVNGINTGMNTDIEAAFSDDYVFEAFLAEAIIQNLKAGYYIDISDIKRNFKHEHFSKTVTDYAKKFNIC
ncbi:MAG: helix-turn-helix transcriptional regulator [Clostridia bacterium]|nr:helix-turn-helix transcriptional regulator [Clostridia bacterium]